MRQEQKQIVRETFALILPISDTVGAMLYARLFELKLSLRRLFKIDIVQQGRHLMGAVSMAVESLDRLEDLLPLLRQLGQRHAAYGVRDEHYALAGEALLWVLERQLGDAYTPEVGEAWGETYWIITTAMMQGAAERKTGAAADLVAV